MHRILLVDDDRDLALCVKARLTECGYEVVCAENALGAINLIANAKPDLILLDMTMPGWSGFKVVEWMKESPAGVNVPFIVVSGHGEGSYEAMALVVGAVAFLQKPVDSEKLLATIHKSLGQPVGVAAERG